MEDWSKKEKPYRYMMLSRLKMDCDYYFGNGGQNPDHLWAGNEQSQIENMIALWETFDLEDKPEWLTWGDILYYALKMRVRIDTRPKHVMYFRKNREDGEDNE
jgi:hypothetical protein